MRGKVGLERRCYSYDSSLHLSQTIGLCASPLWLCLEPSFSLASFCIQKGNRISFSSPKWGPWKHITPWGHGTNAALQIVFLQHLLVSGIFLCFLQHISCCDSIFTVSAWESVWEESLSLLPQPVTYHIFTESEISATLPPSQGHASASLILHSFLPLGRGVTCLIVGVWQLFDLSSQLHRVNVLTIIALKRQHGHVFLSSLLLSWTTGFRQDGPSLLFALH